MNNQEQKSSSRKFFTFYCIILFLFAAILITMSYLSRSRVESEAEAIRKQLSDKTTFAEGVTSRLEAANEKNAELQTTILEQKTQLDEVKASYDIEVKKVAARDYLWQLLKARLNKKPAECREIIKKIDAEHLREFLSQDALNELKKIEKYAKG